MDILQLKIITPKKVIFDEKIYSLTAPTLDGEITILPHHITLITMLVEGIIKIKRLTGEDYLAIGGGYLETDGFNVNILVSSAYGQESINQKLIEKAIEEASMILRKSEDKQQRLEAAALLRRSLIDMKLLRKKKRIAVNI